DNVADWRRVASGKASLLYLSPERLMTERMIAALAKLPVRLFAIDESHCVSQWGHDFRPEYAALARLSEQFPDVPIAAFTATADETTRNEIVNRLMKGQARVFVSGFDRPNLSLSVEPKVKWKEQLRKFLKGRHGQSGIVYCLSRKKTEQVAEMLNQEGYQAIAYHAGLDNAIRMERQNRFLTEPGLVMVATIAFGMGIDKPDVRFVAHTDLPSSVEAYYQEIGRAGRDGGPADTLLLFGLDDIRMRRMFIDDSGASDQQKRIEHQKLGALLRLCEASECRRKVLLVYFGEAVDDCDNCDNCRSPVKRIDGTEAARQLLSVIVATDEIFGVQYVIDCLAGKTTDKVKQNGHDRLSCFGIGRHLSVGEWRAIIRQMVSSGHLAIDIGGYGSLKITASGARISRGNGEFSYRPDVAGPVPSRRSARKPARDDALASVDFDAKLFDKLKQRRLALANEKGVPAFVIFHDRTLEDMAARLPRTLDELGDIHGVGQSKLNNFGATMLAEILAHLERT
ncbi:MAG: RecQ family ATP-dependent DNA helicase, partial [Sphingomonadales bacterium]